MDIKQHGVRKCTLYENKNIVYHYPQQLRHDLVDSVSTDGITIEITQCERIDFDFELAPSQNEILEYTFYLRFFYAGFGVENITLLDKLDNPNGFIALIEMQDNETKYVVPAALKIEPMNIQNQSNAAFNYVMKNEVPTLEPLYEYSKSASPIPRNGLVGEWLFSGSADDTSGYGNDGTVTGATLTQDRFGNTDSAYLFNGNSDYIEIGDVLDIGLSDWSISVWANPNIITGVRGIISKAILAAGFGRWVLAINNSSDLGLIQGTGGSFNVTAFASTGWQYFTLICERSGNMSLYIDNVLVDSIDISRISSEDLQSDIILRIGCYNDPLGNPGNYFGGTIDDVRIYNRVLTQAEIDILYNE